jgi:hypothetical protein
MRRSPIRGALAAVALAAAVAVVPVVPAHAVGEPITVSADGVTFADDLPLAIFGGARIVPGGSATRSIWVRNNTAEPGNLAIALMGVTSADPHMRAGLRLRAATPSLHGPVRPFTAANPCVSLLSGVPLAAGATLQIDLVLSLSGSLSGKASQGSVGGFTIPLTLTSTDVPAPDGCSAATPPVVPVDPTGPTGPTGPTPPGTIGAVDLTGAADGTVPLPAPDAGALAGLGGKGTVRSFDTIPNTGRFWQEFDIVGYLLAIALGCLLAWGWRRRDTEQEVYA